MHSVLRIGACVALFLASAAHAGGREDLSAFTKGLKGLDGRFTQQVLFAAYQSMGSGCRVDMPFDAYGCAKPIDLWFNPRRR